MCTSANRHPIVVGINFSTQSIKHDNSSNLLTNDTRLEQGA